MNKDWKLPNPEATPSQLTERLQEMKSTLRVQDPSLVAVRSACSWLTLGPNRGELRIPLFGEVCLFPFPELTGYDHHDNPLPDFQQALLLYYLVTADGMPVSGRWVSFADLPDGRMYNAAFQSYSGDAIAKKFGLNLDAFKRTCAHKGGKSVEIASASFVFQALPCVPLLVTFWLGDEDFPSSCKILFDESASHYLPIDACAILGSMLTRKIIHV
ncbi:MAG: DUF3786 domain-containing protein [Chloroflexota bacterium]